MTRVSALLAVLPFGLGCLQPAPVSFELENGSTVDRFVQQRDVNADEPAWLRVFNEESVPLRHSAAGACACPCGEGFGCDVECALVIAEVEPLAAGAVARFDWDGLERRLGDGCVREVPVPGEVLSVEVCAGDDVVDDPQTGGRIVADTSRACRRVDFARDDGTVRVVLD